MGPTSAVHRVTKASWLNGLGISTATTWSSSRQHVPPGAPRPKVPPLRQRASPVIPQSFPEKGPKKVGEGAASTSTSAAGRGEFESDQTCVDP